MNRIATTLAAGALALALVPPAHADGAGHELWQEDWEGTEAFGAGEGPCVDWPGTLHETRHGGYRLVTAPGGREDGEFHVNGAVQGHVELTPDDPALPTYAGDYREKINGVITGYDEEQGDLVRVLRYGLRLPLTGTDGSRIVLVMSGKVTVDAGGTMRVARDRYECR